MKNKNVAGKRSDRSRPLLQRVNPNAAGIDCGSAMPRTCERCTASSEDLRSAREAGVFCWVGVETPRPPSLLAAAAVTYA